MQCTTAAGHGHLELGHSAAKPRLSGTTLSPQVSRRGFRFGLHKTSHDGFARPHENTLCHCVSVAFVTLGRHQSDVAISTWVGEPRVSAVTRRVAIPSLHRSQPDSRSPTRPLPTQHPVPAGPLPGPLRSWALRGSSPHASTYGARRRSAVFGPSGRNPSRDGQLRVAEAVLLTAKGAGSSGTA